VILVLKVMAPMAVLVKVPGDFLLLTVTNLQKVKLDVTAGRGGGGFSMPGVVFSIVLALRTLIERHRIMEKTLL
jgi:hypothetical protein